MIDTENEILRKSVHFYTKRSKSLRKALNRFEAERDRERAKTRALLKDIARDLETVSHEHGFKVDALLFKIQDALAAEVLVAKREKKQREDLNAG